MENLDEDSRNNYITTIILTLTISLGMKLYSCAGKGGQLLLLSVDILRLGPIYSDCTEGAFTFIKSTE